MYCTIDDVKKSLSYETLRQLSNDDPSADVIDEAVIEQTIQAAGEFIDGYLRGRYTLPLPELPTIVNRTALSIVRHDLYMRRPDGQDLPEAIRRGYNDAIRTLDHIQHGKITLGVVETSIDMPESGEIRARSTGATFSDSMLDLY